MMLDDYAAVAMLGLVTKYGVSNVPLSPEDVANQSYLLAQAMLDKKKEIEEQRNQVPSDDSFTAGGLPF